MNETAIDERLRTLLDLARAEGVAPVPSGPKGFQNLSEEQRILLALLPRLTAGSSKDGVTSVDPGRLTGISRPLMCNGCASLVEESVKWCPFCGADESKRQSTMQEMLQQTAQDVQQGAQVVQRQIPRQTSKQTHREPTIEPPILAVKMSVVLKNARMNEPYASDLGVEGLADARLVDDGGTGLQFDEQSSVLRGTAIASGVFALRFEGLLDGRRCDVSASLAVIPDPRSLWVAKPSDRNARYWKEDEAVQQTKGALLCVGASKRGRSHAQEGLMRDDDFCVWTSAERGRWSIAAVADGAGSAQFSREGSRIAVQTVLRQLPDLLEEHLTAQIDSLISDFRGGVAAASDQIRLLLYRSLAGVAFNAAKAIIEEAKITGERASSFSTTLVISVARKGPQGWFVAGFSIGDGGVVVLDLPNRDVVALTRADGGEFAGQTRFLQTSEFSDGAAMKRIFFDVRDTLTAVVAMTDGISDPKFPTEADFASPETWMRFWEEDLSAQVDVSRNNPNLARDLLAWMDFWSPGNHDDRTLVMMLA
jgi:hypothetical protein